MTYNEAISKIHGTEKFGSKLGLSRMTALMTALENPQDKLRFVHIAGTNGKGSVSAMTAAAAAASGKKCGLYISPYVCEFRERISINGEMISKGRLAEIAEKVFSEVEKLGGDDPITEFEIVTAIGFCYFAEENCDIVVLETGLGGRFDATNIIKAPEVAAITSIDFDHTEILGDTIAKIAFEKCGIIKEGCGAVVSYPKQANEASDLIIGTAFEKGAPIVFPDLSELSIIDETLSRSEISYFGEKIFVPFIGRHQIYNAITAAEILRRLKIPLKGIEDAKMPARIEILSKEPLVILDGGHNLSGVQYLAEAMKKHLCGKKITAVMGMLRDKDYKRCIAEIASLCDAFYAAEPDSPRKLLSNEAAAVAANYCKKVFCEKDVVSAIKKAREQTPEVLLICGSLYMAGAARNYILENE